jgi:integration host factor subunit beta
MVKAELIQKLRDRADLNRIHAEKVVDIFFDTISDTLTKGERVEIRGFGSFSVNSYKSYVGRNPKTGDQIHVSAKKLPFFRVGKRLKSMVDNKTGG